MDPGATGHCGKFVVDVHDKYGGDLVALAQGNSTAGDYIGEIVWLGGFYIVLAVLCFLVLVLWSCCMACSCGPCKEPFECYTSRCKTVGTLCSLRPWNPGLTGVDI